MKTTEHLTASSWPRAAAVAAACLAAGVLGLVAQTIPNPSFEADTFTGWPGYISGNAPITGWTANMEDRAGLNPAGGSPFADNGAVPDGNNVAFIQSAGASILSTTMSGLVPGTTYKLTFRANARSAGVGQTPTLRVITDNQELLGMTVYSAGGANPYWHVGCEFTATAASQSLDLMNDADGDNTVLVDDFTLAPTSGMWSAAAWNGDEDSGVDAQYFYTHAYNFGSGAGPTINGVAFTGVPGGAPAVPGRFSTTFFGNVFNGDANNITGACADMARDFCYGGTIPAGTFQSITMEGLTPGLEYVATLFTVGWEDPGLTIRWATFSLGDDHMTFNQDQYYNNNGLAISCRYRADATGSATIKIVPICPNNVSVHVYGFCNREAVSRFVAPVILGDPAGVTVAEGQPATFTVSASALPQPTYQWRFKGQNIGGATDPSYTLVAVLPADAGAYDVVVANSVGSATSKAAGLVVGLPMVNPSFEEDAFNGWPGYVSGNWPITGWASLGGHGVNPVADGSSPFADNGIIPHGKQVAFMQEDGPLSQTVSGLVPGNEYYLHYFENARNGGTPYLEVKLGGNTAIAAHPVTQVGGAAYHEKYSDVFVAGAADLEVAFVKSNPLGGDTTALVDNAALVRVAPGSAPFVALNPQPVLASVGDAVSFAVQGVGSLPLQVQWLKDGAEIPGANGSILTLNLIQKPAEGDYSARVSNGAGSATSAAAHLTIYEPIPDLFNTGVDASRGPLADGLADLHYRLIDNPDTGSPDAIVEDSTVFPISTATWLADTATSKWIGPQLNTALSAIGLYTYRTTIDLTDRDTSTVIIEGLWASDNSGRDIRVNGVSTGNPQSGGFGAYTAFTIKGTEINFVAGPNTIDFVVENEAAIGYTGLRVEIVRSNVKVPAGTKPEILADPLSQKAAEGDTVTFTASARGTAPLSYQWNKNGTPIPGQTGLALTLANVTAADSGDYTLTVSNAAGKATSKAANLNVWLRPIPGIAFGTGLDATGAMLPGGSVDPHYVLSASDDPDFPGPDAIVLNDAWPVGTWLPHGPNSKWISPQESQRVGNAEGNYTYQTTVDLTGLDVSKIVLMGGWAVDNLGTNILVNGVSSGVTSGGFGGLSSFTISQGLNAGVNVLDFLVNNLPTTPNPTGLRVDLKAYLILNQVQKATVSISQAGTTLTVSWTPVSAGQKLQSAPALSGPWAEVAGASSPYTTTATGTMQFFRVVSQ